MGNMSWIHNKYDIILLSFSYQSHRVLQKMPTKIKKNRTTPKSLISIFIIYSYFHLIYLITSVQYDFNNLNLNVYIIKRYMFLN